MTRPRLKCLKTRLEPKSAGGWQPDAVRGTRQERGYGAAWERLRRQILARDEGLCQPCREADRLTLATAVDHVVPKSQGGSDDPANLRAICHACHAAKTARESRGPGGGGLEENGRGGRTALSPGHGFFSHTRKRAC